MRRFRLGKDFFAGLLFIVFGLIAVAIGSRYPTGSTARMGPGYFPVLVGGLLAFIGLVTAVRGVRADAEAVARMAIKPLVLVLAAVLLFAASTERLGLAIALLAVIVVGYLANPRWRPLELAMLALVLTAASVLVFHYALKLPFKVWPGPA